ncbi:MAG: gamma-glutamylcyclotransferase [Alcanivorax sp.]|nr:gamma-glutamylcyclotransferase [Alcanivorax sp.]
MTIYYFAYGSNMNPARMASRGMRYRRSVAGFLEGWTLAFNKRANGRDGRAYANIVEDAGGGVEGVLYELVGAGEIARMDPFEGHPERYRRHAMMVRAGEGPIDTWVYIANEHWQSDTVLPERWYLNHLLSGRPWLSEKYYRWLLATECWPDATGPARG